jgi:chromosome segregation ATPase
MEHERRTMTLNLTYDELADRLGTTRNAARVLAQRRKWHRYTSQDDGRARVRVPEEELEHLGARRGGTGAEHEPPHDVPQVNGEIEALKAHVQTFHELLERKDATHAAELERALAEQMRLIEDRAQLQDELQEARAEADHAKSDQVRMARDVATMFDELRAMADRHAEMHADRARLQADVDRLAVELEQARRPWWRRLVGR